jgi:serine/threonine-protein kinase SRPK3
MAEDELLKTLGMPQTEILSRLDGKPLDKDLPTQLIETASWEDWIDEDDEDIRIVDFSESFFRGAEPTKLAQPVTLRVPETIFENEFDYRVDLWRAGCMVRELA